MSEQKQEISLDPVGYTDPVHGDFSRVERLGWKPVFTDDQVREYMRIASKIEKSPSVAIIRALMKSIRARRQ